MQYLLPAEAAVFADQSATTSEGDVHPLQSPLCISLSWFGGTLIIIMLWRRKAISQLLLVTLIHVLSLSGSNMVKRLWTNMLALHAVPFETPFRNLFYNRKCLGETIRFWFLLVVCMYVCLYCAKCIALCTDWAVISPYLSDDLIGDLPLPLNFLCRLFFWLYIQSD